MMQQKIQTMLHRDVDGVKVDSGQHARRPSSHSARQLHHPVQHTQDAAHLSLLAQRRRALAANGHSPEEQVTPSSSPPPQRRASSAQNLNNPASATMLATVLRRQQQMQQQSQSQSTLQSRESVDNPSDTDSLTRPSPSSVAGGSDTLILPVEPSPEVSSGPRMLKARPQIRSWKKTRDRPQDTEESLLLLESRYRNGVFPDYIRRSRLSGAQSNEASDKDGDTPSETAHSDDEQGGQSNTTNGTEEKKTAVSRLEASLRRKGNKFSQLSHKFRDLMSEKFQSMRKDGNASSSHPSSDASSPKNGAASANNSLNKEQALALTRAMGGMSSPTSDDQADERQLSPLAGLRDRDKLITERDHSSALPWKPRALQSPSSSFSEVKETKGSSLDDADDGPLRLQVNGASLDLFKASLHPSPSPSNASSSSSATRSSPNSSASPSIADTLAAAAAAAAFSSDSSATPLLRTFTSPTSLHKAPSSLSAAPRDGMPLFLRKQSTDTYHRRPDSLMDTPGKDRERSSSNASALNSPSFNNGMGESKWAQELAGLRQHVTQHSSDMEVQISDIESALTNADIGSLKARLELLEDLQRNKRNDVEGRLQRMEAELQNMKQMQRANLKTIYDALSSQNLSTAPRRNNLGMSGTLMNWIYVLITWFGLGIATMSQPLAAIYDLYPYVAPLACCRRKARNAQDTTAATFTQPDPFMLAPTQPATNTAAGPQQPFLPTALHHHSDRDRHVISRTKIDRERERERERALPARHRRTHTRQASNGASLIGEQRGERDREDDESVATGPSSSVPVPSSATLHRTPPSSALSLTAAVAPLSDDDDDDVYEDANASRPYSDAPSGDHGDERELASLTDSDTSSLQSDMHASSYDLDGALNSSRRSDGSTGPSRSSSRGSVHAPPRPALSTMAQLRNASKRLQAANRRT